jgi:NAD(P)-dependent dehydrogenase (short-subunit alcohol dehydrogenase family)
MAKNNVLVTGSNSGFGRLISLALARGGHTVFATMRSPATKNAKAAGELRALADAERLALHVLELDVTDDRSVATAVETALGIAGHLDVVVNNAGYALGGLSETFTSEQFLAELNTNVVGMHRVNRAVLPAMRARGAGLIIHISSTQGRLTMPFYGLYCASKWALEAMAEGYRYELKPTGVEVSIVQPGPFKTPFMASSPVGADPERESGYGPLAGGFAKLVGMVDQMFAAPDAPDPEEIARAVVTLVGTAPGTRPLRVMVDPSGAGAGAAVLNEAAAGVQRANLAGLGMSALVD